MTRVFGDDQVTIKHKNLGYQKLVHNIKLVGGLEHFLFFHFIYGIILPIDELIFFKMVKTTNQMLETWWEKSGKMMEMVGKWLEPDQLTWKSTYWMATPIQHCLQL